MITAQGSTSSVRNGVNSTYTTLTGINGPNPTTWNEAPGGAGLNRVGPTFTCALSVNTATGVPTATCPTGQPSTLTTGFTNFWVLTMNNAGQVKQATHMGRITPPAGDPFQVVSSGSARVVIEARGPSGGADTSTSTQAALGPYGFSTGCFTITNGTAFSGVMPQTYIGLGGLRANDVVNLYFVPASQYSTTGTSTTVTPSYAIVDTYR